MHLYIINLLGPIHKLDNNIKTILFNKKSYLKILQALLQANQNVRIHVVVICISLYYTINLVESVNIVNITYNMHFVMLAVSTHAQIWFIHMYYSCLYVTGSGKIDHLSANIEIHFIV